MKYFRVIEFKNSKFYLLVSLLMLQSLLSITLITPKASATPTFSSFPISSTHKLPGAMTVAGGDLFYLQKTSGSSTINSIGRMTTSGATLNYNIGFPSGKSSFSVREWELITASDGNVWFSGISGGVYIGKLDIATGAITFYSSGIASYSAGGIGVGPDGKIYYTAKYAGLPANSYLLSLDPTSGSSTIIKTYDAYSTLGNVTAGQDGRLYITDAYYQNIYAIAITGGADSTHSFSTPVNSLTYGANGNLWFTKSNKIVKMNSSGATTEFALPTGVSVNSITKLINGPDDAIWFFNAGTSSTPKIGRISNTGYVTSYSISATGVSTISNGPVVGPDNAIWVSYSSLTANKLGRITTSPNLTEYPISSTHRNPSSMTTMNGDMFYLQNTDTSGVIDSIGKMTPSGAVTNYNLGYPTGHTSISIRNKLIAGPGGCIWFTGSVSGGMYLGKLDLTTGATTYVGAGGAYSAGDIGVGPDGKIYYVYKTSSNPSYTYLKSYDPATDLISTVHTFDNYSAVGNIITGPDNRLYVTDAYYNYIRAFAVTGGTESSFSTPGGASSLTSGSDGNLWYVKPGKILKATLSGAITEYDVSSTLIVNTNTKLISGPDGSIWIYNAGSTTTPKLGRITQNGATSSINLPVYSGSIGYEHGGPIVGPDDTLWLNYSTSSSNQKLVKIGY